MGCSGSVPSKTEDTGHAEQDKIISLQASIIIQKWYRRSKALLEMRRRCTWKIFQEIEYSSENDQINLYNFFNKMFKSLNKNDKPECLFWNNLHQCTNKKTSVNILPSFKIDSNYTGPKIDLPITIETIHTLLEYFKGGNRLHASYVDLILCEATSHMKTRPNITCFIRSFPEEITVVGDLHGKFEDLYTILYKNGLPSATNPYIFNGDFVDRGEQSLEIVITLCCLVLLNPKHVTLNRGNHEDSVMNSRYGFTRELVRKYKIYAGHINMRCQQLFRWLPLATVVENKVLVVHGGVSMSINTKTIEAIQRDQFVSLLQPDHISEDEKDDLPEHVLTEWEHILDLLWSDPQFERGQKFNGMRGGGCLYGPDVTSHVLAKNKWELIVRSHECKFEGYEFTHDDKVLTVFSASSYYAEMSNYGAYVKIGIDYKPRIVQFTASKDMTATIRKRVGLNEDLAMKNLKNKIFSHREKLTEEFKSRDTSDNGQLTMKDWSASLESVLKLKLPWSLLQPKLTKKHKLGTILYMTIFDGYQLNPECPSLSETIYRQKETLETVFRLIDKDCSGYISIDEFRESCALLNDLGKQEDGIADTAIDDLAKTLDINKDGMIDFNEFLEAFRLVSIGMAEKT